MRISRTVCALLAAMMLCLLDESIVAQDARDTSRGDQMIAGYFAARTKEIANGCMSEIRTQADWDAVKDQWRSQLFEMLGLDPLPEKTPLQPVITGTTEHDEFIVERLHFQSRPGLYVTGNLYRPKQQSESLPAILYVCGHGRVKKGDISFGNKAQYQHHGGWFARNGYVCLIIDTLQLGEIEGIHHGTYSHDRWWWNARGYTSAGVEAWNCIRALDYLQSRPEVDGERIGVTGRSGGGAYSWWIAALDERIKVAVPVAGITNLTNHVIDGCVEGHCDCMYMVNTYRWDYAQVAALVAPRPLLISNTDKDGIFPLDGVVDVYNRVRKIYELHGKRDHIGLQICEGPHKDTQELRIHAFHWFNRFLKNEDPLIEMAAVKFFEPEQLRVFDELPADELNTSIDETFTRTAELPEPDQVEITDEAVEQYRQRLLKKCFRGWPGQTIDPTPRLQFESEHEGVHLAAYEFDAEDGIRLPLYVVHSASVPIDKLQLTVLNVVDEPGWLELLGTLRPAFGERFADEAAAPPNVDAWESLKGMVTSSPWGMAWLCPRGIGPTAWDQSVRKQTQYQRRFMLLGQTLDGMRVWDTRRALHALRSVDGMASVPLWLQAEGTMAGTALYAALFEGRLVTRLDLYGLSASHRNGPVFLNVLRVTDMPVTVAMTAADSRVVIYDNNAVVWGLPVGVVQSRGMPKQLQIRPVPGSNPK